MGCLVECYIIMMSIMDANGCVNQKALWPQKAFIPVQRVVGHVTNFLPSFQRSPLCIVCSCLWYLAGIMPLQVDMLVSVTLCVCLLFSACACWLVCHPDDHLPDPLLAFFLLHFHHSRTFSVNDVWTCKTAFPSKSISLCSTLLS